MKTFLPTVAAIALIGVLAGCGDDEGEPAAEAPAPFGYSGESGPSHWASLDPTYERCAAGRRQSPIQLTGARPADLPPIAVSYEPGEVELENNGHGVEAAYPPGSSIEVAGGRYELEQFHFHAPGEHRLDGRSFPLEFHFVHAAEDGAITVLGAFVAEGARNPAFDPLVEALPAREGETAPVAGAVDARDLLPRGGVGGPRYSYEGSLTTPPCTEGVRWEVLKRPLELSAEQIDAYTSIYDDTNRPIQPLNDRPLRVSRR